MTTASRRLKVYFKMTILYLLLKKVAKIFPLITQDILLSYQDIVLPTNMIVEYEYSKSFQISGDNCIVKDMLKTNLINESFAT